MSRALARDYSTADVSAQDAEMLAYAVKLTRAPHSITADDVDRLRSVAFSDAAVLDICQVVSYYNYVNRLADGLGVKLEEFWKDADLTIDRSEFDRRAAHRHATDRKGSASE